MPPVTSSPPFTNQSASHSGNRRKKAFLSPDLVPRVIEVLHWAVLEERLLGAASYYISIRARRLEIVVPI